jgi:hypothetical protein
MRNIKKYGLGLIMTLFVGAYFVNMVAQNQQGLGRPPQTLEERREMRRSLVVKEFNTDAKGKREWMDRLSVWNNEGYKIEDIEYAVYGQKERITYHYDAEWKCIREDVYNDKNKLVRIRKFEYNDEGRKAIQYNYLPNGKLFSTKVFDYSYR